jgi:lipopolysaccharide export system permease protein
VRILDKYILKELLIPLFFCIAGGLAFYVTFDLFSCMDDLQRSGGGFKVILWYNIARIPELLVLILPPALLLALLYAISNHSRNNEIVAMRAAGVSIWRICAPYISVGIILGVCLFYLNETWVPMGARLAKDLRKGTKHKKELVYENVNFTNTKDNRTWNIGEYHVEDKRLVRPSVEWLKREEGSLALNTVKLEAESAEWRPSFSFARDENDDGTGSKGVWEFHNVQLFTYTSEGEGSMLPVPEKYETLQVPEIDDSPEEIESEIFISGFDSFKSARKANLTLKEITMYLRLHQGVDSQLVTRVKTLYHSRIAAPFTCLVVVLVALPFSLQGGRRNVFVGVASSIVICFCFFLLNEVSLALGEGGYMPPWLCAWLPNVLFGVGGFTAVKNLA